MTTQPITISEEARHATFVIRQYFNRPWQAEIGEFKDEVARQIQFSINSATEKLAKDFEKERNQIKLEVESQLKLAEDKIEKLTAENKDLRKEVRKLSGQDAADMKEIRYELRTENGR